MANSTIPMNRRTPPSLAVRDDLQHVDPRVARLVGRDALAVAGEPAVHGAGGERHEPAPPRQRGEAVPDEVAERVAEARPELGEDLARRGEAPGEPERPPEFARERPVRPGRAARPVGELEALRAPLEVDEGAVR